MTHVLDALPLDFTDPKVQQLETALIQTFPTAGDLRMVLRKAGISEAYVNLVQPTAAAWQEVLDVARRQDRLRVLVAVVIREPNSAAIRPTLEALLADTLAATPSAEAPPPDEPIAWKSDPTPDGLERQIGAQSTLLDVSFLQRGLEISPSVVKLVVTLNDGKRYNGTGFRISDDLLLTNHHVLFDDQGPATTVEAWYGYERSFAGATREPQVLACDQGTIVGRKDHDWAAVRVASPVPAQARPIAIAGAPTPAVADRVYIIQHPDGRVKQIGMVHNTVVKVDDDRIGYLTDTEGGSSGSPVFDEQWRLVGLHHRWETDVVGGRRRIYNQGVRIERVVEGLAAAGVVLKGAG